MPTLDELATGSQTDWNRLRTQTDADIARAVDADPDSAPIPTADEMKRFEPSPARHQK